MRIAVLLTGLLPITAQAQVYANEAGCARLAGKVANDGVIIWAEGAFEFWESRCPITGSQQAGSGAALVTLECSGEGDTWETYYMIETTSDVDRYVVYPSDYPEIRSELTSCQ
ncbi:hypothetical protein [Pseudooctadecabacter jejudonensis]|uniref:Uncharacterized protein n=1 Tax=Pseudooctadecabacter jejudonensis TaxID=1391910 RepID=A0A1Y5RWP9_9RHOB|nr:hypothetical protein [Pseudooctadecabacter jejudonensis]SLN26941.1 hypothetical protein PSJ8397_01101 [Pseudooctadecabacter jejudonensis]